MLMVWLAKSKQNQLESQQEEYNTARIYILKSRYSKENEIYLDTFYNIEDYTEYEPLLLEVEWATRTLKDEKSLGYDIITAEIIKMSGYKSLSSIM